jgi:hypothetical protein
MTRLAAFALGAFFGLALGFIIGVIAAISRITR